MEKQQQTCSVQVKLRFCCCEVTLSIDLISAVPWGWGSIPDKGIAGRNAGKLAVLRTLGGPELWLAGEHLLWRLGTGVLCVCKHWWNGEKTKSGQTNSFWCGDFLYVFFMRIRGVYFKVILEWVTIFRFIHSSIDLLLFTVFSYWY